MLKSTGFLLAALAFGLAISFASDASAQTSSDGRQWRAFVDVCVTSPDGERACGVIQSRQTYPSKEVCENETLTNLLVARARIVGEGGDFAVRAAACVPEPGVYDTNGR